MESFMKRSAPHLAKKPVLEPSVPDVSLLIHTPPQNTYRNWKNTNVQNDSCFAQKQVRFNSPQQPVVGNTTNVQSSVKPGEKVFDSEKFQEIYMGNIPNRHLDLSLLELVKTKPSSLGQKVGEDVDKPEPVVPKIPKTYKEFLEQQENCVTDIFNYNSPKNERVFNVNSNRKQMLEPREIVLKSSDNARRDCETSIRKTFPKENTEMAVFTRKSPHNSRRIDEVPIMKNDTCVQTSFVNEITEITKNNEEPTVRDLLKIIQQQNEQLLLLQKQVTSLINTREQQYKQVEAQREPELPTIPAAGSPLRKGPLPKFSMNLMTSFEVSIRPQNMHRKRQMEPKIREITEDEFNNEKAAMNEEDSIGLQESIRVRENCPSPEPSINIEMKDYDSSSSGDENEDPPEIGASFYRNLMEQVNKIIRNANTEEQQQFREQTLSQVKDATLKQLRKLGLNFSTIDEVTTPNCSFDGNSMTNDDRVSFVVKQLLMKYLPDDKLAKLTTKNAPPPKQVQEKIVLNSRAPEFSFATIQFMKKYDLISSLGPDVKKTTKGSGKIKTNCPKILDITALKQQPKLL